MSDNNLSGITGYTEEDDKLDKITSAESILTELEVGDLSELSPSELEKIKTAIEDTGDIEGVAPDAPEDEAVISQGIDQARQIAQQRREQVLQQQLQEIEDVADAGILLQRIARSMAELNATLASVQSLIEENVEVNKRGASLIIKEAESITFRSSNRPRRLVDDETIRTSTIILKSNANNNGDLFLGEESVSETSGFRIEPGEIKVLPFDVARQEIEIVSEVEGDEYSYLALGVEL